MKSERLLILRLSALGDVAMTLPAIYSLAERYPALKIDVATRPFFARLFIDPPANVRLVEADFKGRHKGLGGMLRLLRELSALRPDAVADLHNVSRTWIVDAFFRLRGKRVAMVDKMRRQRGEVLKKGASQPNFIDRYRAVFARLGYPVEQTFRSLFRADSPAAPIAVEHPAVGIAPFARYANKTYPPELMRRTAELLCRQGYRVYLFGGRGEEARELERWEAIGPACRSVAGRFTLEEELRLMADMDLMVSMDSANQHMAALAGTRVLSIWGSTTPACGFLGYGQRPETALVAGLPCQPCTIAGSPRCPLGHLDCLNGIDPAAVAARVGQLIQ